MTRQRISPRKEHVIWKAMMEKNQHNDIMINKLPPINFIRRLVIKTLSPLYGQLKASKIETKKKLG